MPEIVPTASIPMPALTPGWKTSEFWLTAAANILGGLAAAHTFDAPGMPTWIGPAVGFGTMLLSTGGYTYHRNDLKGDQLAYHTAALQIAAGRVQSAASAEDPLAPSLSVDPTKPPPAAKEKT